MSDYTCPRCGITVTPKEGGSIVLAVIEKCVPCARKFEAITASKV